MTVQHPPAQLLRHSWSPMQGCGASLHCGQHVQIFPLSAKDRMTDLPLMEQLGIDDSNLAINNSSHRARQVFAFLGISTTAVLASHSPHAPGIAEEERVRRTAHGQRMLCYLLTIAIVLGVAVIAVLQVRNMCHSRYSVQGRRKWLRAHAATESGRCDGTAVFRY